MLFLCEDQDISDFDICISVLLISGQIPVYCQNANSLYCGAFFGPGFFSAG